MLTSLLSKARFLGWPIALVSSAAAIVLGAASFTFETTEPTLIELAEKRGLHLQGPGDTTWYYVVTGKKSPFHGQAIDGGFAALNPKGRPKGFFQETTCSTYTNAPEDLPGADTEGARICLSETRTAVEAERYFRDQMRQQRGTGVPALVG